ncbi:hypothetical protein FQN54_006956 [Arachnomyces sp. PD_36]|nr:hypothetical protein FQN54_006956 [Arachnomyces sp. PD_36]
MHMRGTFLIWAACAISLISGTQEEVGTLAEQAFSNAQSSLSNLCSAKDLAIRREWRTLSKPERRDYIDAVLCLQEKPSRFSMRPDAENFPGVKSRFDDFVAVHINMTMTIHYTANFLSWHRYFNWLYETALRDECGYSGYQPFVPPYSPIQWFYLMILRYWEWSLDADDPRLSPIFDGSEYSMSGNGEYDPSFTGIVLGGNGIPYVPLPPGGSGGGCVYDGPFADMEVNLGPLAVYNVTPVEDLYTYNPRCLKRDLNPYVMRRWSTWSNLTDLFHTEDIDAFQNVMQGYRDSGEWGVHGGGHYGVGGDPEGDFIVSPGDPIFYLHHAQIDRVWWIWQMQDPENREYAISGTRTLMNIPPSANGTLDDLLEVGVLAEARTMRELMSTIDGPLCYAYL